MLSPEGVVFMAVVAVSGSVMLVAMQAHKRLVSEFMKKIEFELGPEKSRHKKKVRFADDVLEPSTNSKEYRQRRSKTVSSNPATSQVEFRNSSCFPASNRVDFQNPGKIPVITEAEFKSSGRRTAGTTMPLNRLALYRGILQDRTRMLNGRI